MKTYYLYLTAITLICVFIFSTGCDNSSKTTSLLDIQGIKTSYQSYIDDGFERVPVDLICVRKDYEKYKLQITFYDNLNTVSSKEWFFLMNKPSVTQNIIITQ